MVVITDSNENVLFKSWLGEQSIKKMNSSGQCLLKRKIIVALIFNIHMKYPSKIKPTGAQ